MIVLDTTSAKNYEMKINVISHCEIFGSYTNIIIHLVLHPHGIAPSF